MNNQEETSAPEDNEQSRSLDLSLYQLDLDYGRRSEVGVQTGPINRQPRGGQQLNARVVAIADHETRGQRVGVLFKVQFANIPGTITLRAENIVGMANGREALRVYLDGLRSFNPNRFNRLVSNTPSLAMYLSSQEDEEYDGESD